MGRAGRLVCVLGRNRGSGPNLRSCKNQGQLFYTFPGVSSNLGLRTGVGPFVHKFRFRPGQTAPSSHA
jgi:hypothetical protein